MMSTKASVYYQRQTIVCIITHSLYVSKGQLSVDKIKRQQNVRTQADHHQSGTIDIDPRPVEIGCQGASIDRLPGSK